MRLIPCYTNNGLYYYYYLSVGHWACVLDPAFCGLLPKVNWTSLQWRILWNVPNDAEKDSVHLFLVLYKYTCGRVILHTLQATSATHIAHVFKAPFWTSTWHDVGVLSSPGFSRFCRNSQCHHHSSGQWWIMKRLPTTLFQSSPSVEIVNACSPGRSIAFHCRVQPEFLGFFDSVCSGQLSLQFQSTRYAKLGVVLWPQSSHFMTWKRTRWYHL